MFEWMKDSTLEDEDFNVEDIEPLIDGFIFSSGITLIASTPKQGKTWLAYGIALVIANNTDKEHIFYFDMDNPIGVLKERGIDKRFMSHPKVNYTTRSKIPISPIEFLKKVAEEAKPKTYENCVFFLDTIKDFVDVESNAQANQFMKYCVMIRDAGGTVIILHHANISGRGIRGTSVFLDTPDNVFSLTQISKINKMINYELSVTYGRNMVKDCKWSVNTKTLELTTYNAIETGLKDTDREAVEKGLVALEDAEDGLSQSALIQAMGFGRTDRNGKRIAVEMVGHYWRLEEINSKLSKYYLLED